MKKLILILFLLPAGHLPVAAQSADRKAVYDVSMDYIDAFYKSEAYRIERSVYQDVIRRGFYWKGLDSTYSDMRTMTYTQMVQFAKDWNKTKWLPADAVKKVEVLDVQDKTAMTKITVYWGTEYLQLARIDENWKIINIMWQSLRQSSR
jgi:hypothetical protein